MAYLLQASSGIADTQKISLATWFYIPSINGSWNGTQHLFHFGNASLFESQLYLVTDRSLPSYTPFPRTEIAWRLGGPELSEDSGGDVFIQLNVDNYDSVSQTTSTPLFVNGTWNLLCISSDVSESDVLHNSVDSVPRPGFDQNTRHSIVLNRRNLLAKSHSTTIDFTEFGCGFTISLKRSSGLTIQHILCRCGIFS